jgi:hypothetical protein
MSDSALVGSCTVGDVPRVPGIVVAGTLGVGTCIAPEVWAQAHMVNDLGRMRELGGKRDHHGLAGTSIECAGKGRQFDRRLGEAVQLVNERPKLGWVIVPHLIMTKKLIISFVSFWSSPWGCFSDCWPAQSVSVSYNQS